MFKTLILFSIAISTALFGGIEKYYKKINDKFAYPITKMRNIDFIYVINLDQRPEKYAMTLNELVPFGIIPYRFSAVNGWELPLEHINDVGIKYETWMKKNLMGTYYLPENGGEPCHEIMNVEGRNYFCHGLSRGSIGIFLSHLSVLQDAYDSGYETIWVMEDDIEVIKDPNIISDYIEKLEYVMPSNIRMYNIRDDIVSTKANALTDNGLPFYKHAITEQ